MEDVISPKVDTEPEDSEPIGFLEWAGSLLDDLVTSDEKQSTDVGNRGPLGCSTNQPKIDSGTLTRGQCNPPGTQGRVVRLGPFVLKPIEPFDTVKKSEGFGKKFKIDLDVYSELGLAGQITEKFLELPYRSGKIEFESGKLAGKGLVCSSFAKIFGALWFAGDPTKQEKPKAHTMRADVRPRRAYEFGKEWKIVHKGSGMVIGESDSEKKAKERARLRTVSKDAGKTVSSAQVYAAQYNGWLVNVKRLRLRKLIEKLDKKRLYAVVKYGGRTGDNREHVLFLIYANSLSDWVMIHSTGWGRKTGGKGPGPGIYEIPPKGYKSRKFYQAWDWGWAYRPRNPDIERWKYVP